MRVRVVLKAPGRAEVAYGRNGLLHLGGIPGVGVFELARRGLVPDQQLVEHHGVGEHIGGSVVGVLHGHLGRHPLVRADCAEKKRTKTKKSERTKREKREGRVGWWGESKSKGGEREERGKGRDEGEFEVRDGDTYELM